MIDTLEKLHFCQQQNQNVTFFQSAIVLPTQVDPQMYIGLHDQPVRNELDNGHRHGRSLQRR